MRLVWFELHGYGRFERASLNLDARVIALLGANEAGKTTILRALAELGDGRQVNPRSLTRGLEPPEDAISEAWFLLEEHERTELAGALPEASESRWYVFEKSVTGKLTHRIEPRPQRDIARRAAMIASIERLAATKWIRGEDQEQLRRSFAALRRVLESTAGTLNATSNSALRATDEYLAREDDKAPKQRQRVRDELRSLIGYEELEHPHDRALDMVAKWRPDLLIFGSDARVLESEYDLDIIATSPPAALRNLAAISGLDLPALRGAARSSRPEVAEDLTERANARLREIFGRAWRQSEIEVRFGTDGTALHVMVRSDQGALHRIAERSDGLKIFVSLVSFLVAAGTDRPILLVDEADQHLHWDGQADLVGMLHRQDRAAQVVYTTHSPGCLPQDLGAGIRLVVQSANQPDRSRIVNSIWSEGPGFVPLLIGIGASTAAITPARRALVAEGATEFLLLPALLRESHNLDYLEFQVVPGLAEAGDADFLDLDLAAARVAYFADGDSSGQRLRARVLTRGVPERRVIMLPEGVVIEDLIDPEILFAAIAEETRRSGCNLALPFKPSELPTVGRAKWIERRLASAGRTSPPKPRTAARVLEIGWPSKGGSGQRESIVDRRRMRVLQTVLKKVQNALDIEPAQE